MKFKDGQTETKVRNRKHNIQSMTAVVSAEDIAVNRQTFCPQNQVRKKIKISKIQTISEGGKGLEERQLGG